MTKNKNPEFVGIVEHLTPGSTSYDYCILDNTSGGMTGVPNIKVLGELASTTFGKEFKQKITYEPPKGIDYRGQERGLCSRRYHRLSVLEQDKFERTVIRDLEGPTKSEKENIKLINTVKSQLG